MEVDTELAGLLVLLVRTFVMPPRKRRLFSAEYKVEAGELDPAAFTD
ncbi:hypothetical protein OHA40_31590 [Nocardia sp. NBC_00508]|nr:hypothetical protein [Nocardia sp. NBC_00508]WUD66068.1 hypothetical protein OHA40_31590 [Nocardia sp. NBC_00508]